MANARYWLEEMHVDGLRVDAVASMLYLDYSRKAGEWVPNRHGGRENLEAIAFLQEMNTVLARDYPGVLTVAEESTAFRGVTRPVDRGGLGFTHKWNMGWMHDTLEYFGHEPVHRRWHHDQLTFGLIYAWTENFVLPLSHDEVVHLKGSLLDKMPGDPWQRFANLRALYGWMWAHPGKQLLFMGAELAQEREWSHDREIDWYLLADPLHRGVRDLLRELNAAGGDPPAPLVARHHARRVRLARGQRPRLVGLRVPAPGLRGRRRRMVPASPTSRRCPGTATASACRRRAAGSTCSTPTTSAGAAAGVVQAGRAPDGTPWQGQPDSAVLTLPPLAVRWLVPGG